MLDNGWLGELHYSFPRGNEPIEVDGLIDSLLVLAVVVLSLQLEDTDVQRRDVLKLDEEIHRLGALEDALVELRDADDLLVVEVLELVCIE